MQRKMVVSTTRRFFIELDCSSCDEDYLGTVALRITLRVVTLPRPGACE
jgi:hypothetical protein